MLRDEWGFEFSASKLAAAAADKKAHHEDRLKFWEKAKDDTMAEVRESGIEVSESLAANYSNKSSGHGPQVMVRNDLQTRLTECHQKLSEHAHRVREYDGWIQVLKADPDKRLTLHADDYLYFFGIFK